MEWDPLAVPEHPTLYKDKFTLEVDAWDPQVERWEIYYKRLKKEFEKRTKGYCIRHFNIMCNQNLRPTPRKRARSGSPDLHFQWLAFTAVRLRVK